MAGRKTKESWETSEQFKGRLIKETIEDKILNDMIENDVNILIDDKQASKSVYNNANFETQAVYDTVAFQYFSDAFEGLADRHPRVYEGLSFPNFVKAYAIGDQFMETLQNVKGLSRESIELIWQDIFNQDTGNFKIAALNGFQRSIENSPNVSSESKDTGDVSGIMEATKGMIQDFAADRQRRGDPLERNNNPLEVYELGSGSPWDKI